MTGKGIPAHNKGKPSPLRGTNLSPETIERIREGQLARWKRIKELRGNQNGNDPSACKTETVAQLLRDADPA